VPGRGRTIQSATEERAQHVRKAVHLLEPPLRSSRVEADLEWVFSPRWHGGATSAPTELASNRAAWAIVNVYLLARTAGLDRDATLADAEGWFFGLNRHELPSLTQYISPDEARSALRALSRLSFDEDLLDLLPYVLELFGPGSRLSVMRDPTTRTAQRAKRKSGIFYTPADVAEYMVGEAMAGRKEALCLDPSCGTGVFLAACLRVVDPPDRFGFATRCLYGFDISTTAIESCTFVLLHHCMRDVRVAPWSAWHALRLNLAATDALRTKLAGNDHYAAAALRRAGVRRGLTEGGYTAPVRESLPTVSSPRLSLFGLEDHLPPVGAIFPEAEEGFDVLTGNPPYVPIGPRTDRELLGPEYASLRAGNGTSDLYPAFIEMMWRLTRPGSTSTLVVPLSIAFHQGAQFTACRQAMMSSGGRWRFAFFDREPHALFGEDVKTRNAILFRSECPGVLPRGTPAELETGPLKKWTSHTRNTLFSNLTFTPLRGVSIIDGIPKLCGGEQSHAFTVLSGRHEYLRSFCERFRTCRPHEATLTSKAPRVFVASTAYNFLNVFRSISLDSTRYPLSENMVHCLEFGREDDACIVFSVLSSRLTYWLWHVEGDGFHVGGWFIQHLPFGTGSFTTEQARTLENLGAQLWNSLQAHRIVSVNKGKQTVAYRPLACERERDAIDEVLIDAAKLPKRFNQTLRSFVKNAVVIDDTDTRRSHLKLLFDAPEAPL
jgi:hypothetical protein